jgi:hypothetical protein
MKISARTLHRDLGYFYLGLLIIFSVSGIMLNHRVDFNPIKYEYERRDFQLPGEFVQDELEREDVQKILNHLKIDENRFRYGVHEGDVWVSSSNVSLDFSKTTGVGVLKAFKVRPVLGHMSILHKSTYRYWILYSDIFAIAVIIISITVLLFAKGRYGFRKYGWKLSLAGILIPLLMMMFFV